jgi:surfeit locus 1 family protein
MQTFKPKLIPTIFTIPALILLLSLSYWQFERLHWKNNLIEEITKQTQLPAIDLPENIDLSEMLYRKVKFQGEFIHNQEMHMYGGARQFKGENGYYILTPIKLSNNKVIIINRGWVNEKQKEAKTRPETLTEGMVEVEGSIVKSEEKPLYVHDNQPNRNLWFYVDLNEMKNFLKEPVEKFYIMAKEIPGTSPRGRNLEPNIRNHHLGYALTWLFSAISLMAIYVIYHKKR